MSEDVIAENETVEVEEQAAGSVESAEPEVAEEVAEARVEEAAESGQPARSKREESLTNEGEIAADYLEELLDIADLDGDIDTFNEGGRAHVSIITDSAVLVGKDGQVLEALQELARLVVMTETGHRSRLMLDIAGHRERRREEMLGHIFRKTLIVHASLQPALPRIFEALNMAKTNPNPVLPG